MRYCQLLLSIQTCRQILVSILAHGHRSVGGRGGRGQQGGAARGGGQGGGGGGGEAGAGPGPPGQQTAHPLQRPSLIGSSSSSHCTHLQEPLLLHTQRVLVHGAAAAAARPQVLVRLGPQRVRHLGAVLARLSGVWWLVLQKVPSEGS